MSGPRRVSNNPAKDGFQSLPEPFGTVWMRASDWDNYRVDVCYRGTPADLVRAGIASDAMLLPGRAGKHRQDSQGRSYWRKPMKYMFEVRYLIGRAEAMSLPFWSDPSDWLHRILENSADNRARFEAEAAADPLTHGGVGDDHLCGS